MLSLDRETGHVRSFHVANATVAVVAPIVRADVSKDAHLMTHQAKICKKIGTEYARHDTVNHQEDEYVRVEGDIKITTNTIESNFSIFKRGMRGTLPALRREASASLLGGI